MSVVASAPAPAPKLPELPLLAEEALPAAPDAASPVLPALLELDDDPASPGDPEAPPSKALQSTTFTVYPMGVEVPAIATAYEWPACDVHPVGKMRIAYVEPKFAGSTATVTGRFVVPSVTVAVAEPKLIVSL